MLSIPPKPIKSSRPPNPATRMKRLCKAIAPGALVNGCADSLIPTALREGLPAPILALARNRRYQFIGALGPEENLPAFDQFQLDAAVAAGNVGGAPPRDAYTVAAVVAYRVVGDRLGGLDLAQRDMALAPEAAHSDGKFAGTDIGH